LPLFAKQNIVPILGSLKVSIMSFVTEIVNMYFFETPLDDFSNNWLIGVEKN